MKKSLRVSRHSQKRVGGFSLVEVLVGLMVISVGLLGVARVQALALSSTGTARTRAMVAFSASSLAATMSADREYWSKNTPTVSVNVMSATVSASDSDLQAPPGGGCTASSPCESAAQLAAQDLHDWAVSLQTVLPPNTQPAATVTCQIVGSNPVTCAINIAWTESLVSTTYSSNTAASAQQTLQAVQKVEPTSYTLYTEP